MSEIQSFAVSSLEDYQDIANSLIEQSICGPSHPFAVLIGCSGHSPVPLRQFRSVVNIIGDTLQGMWLPHSLLVLVLLHIIIVVVDVVVVVVISQLNALCLHVCYVFSLLACL
jgi:hypothetical protein